MSCKKKEPVAPAFGGFPIDPVYDKHMKKCLRKYPYLHKMIDYIINSKIAALRAEMYQMLYRPMFPAMVPPVPGPIAGPVLGQPGMGPHPMMPPGPGFPMMPM